MTKVIEGAKGIKARYSISRHFDHHLCILGLILVSIVLVGCDSGIDSVSLNEGQYQVRADSVIVGKGDIFSTKPELYQPSFNLSGVLVPVNQQQIHSPNEAYIQNILVSLGDWVTTDDPLITLRLDIPSTNDTTESTTQAPPTVTEDNVDTSPISSDKPEPAKNTENNRPDSLPSQTKNKKAEHDVKANMNDSVKTRPKPIKVDDAEQSATKELLEIVKEKLLPDEEETDDQTNITIEENGMSIDSQTDPTVAPTAPRQKIITLNAPQDGEVVNIAVSPHANVTTGQPLITVADPSQLKLVGELPIETQSQLSVGQPVNFTILDLHEEFTGQVSDFVPDDTESSLNVHALVNTSSDTKTHLEPGMRAAMIINYGQMQLGVRLPRRGIHDINLSSLTPTHTRPASPLKGYVWVIEQDQRLLRQSVEVVEYYPETDQFLVSGISNDSLVCLINFNKNNEGKMLRVK